MLKNKRIILAALAVAMTLAFAASAFAYCGRYGDGWGPGRDDGGRGLYGHGFGGPWLWDSNADIPQEIRGKMDEARSAMDELRAELSKNPVDKDKALALFRKERDIRNEISEWFFLQRIENISQGSALSTQPK
jgi:Spy/CpxP family protein refolding chaperone